MNAHRISLQKLIGGIALVLCGLLAAPVQAAKKPNQSFEDYKGQYSGTWVLQAVGSGMSISSGVAGDRITITSAQKGKKGRVTINADATSAQGSPLNAFVFSARFAGRSLSLNEVAPLLGSGYPVNGSFSRKKNAIVGKINVAISTTLINATYTLTTRSTKAKQMVKVVYVANLDFGGSGGQYIYTFNGSRKLKK